MLKSQEWQAGRLLPYVFLLLPPKHDHKSLISFDIRVLQLLCCRTSIHGLRIFLMCARKKSREQANLGGARHLEFLTPLVRFWMSCYVIANGYRLVQPYLHTSKLKVKGNGVKAIEVFFPTMTLQLLWLISPPPHPFSLLPSLSRLWRNISSLNTLPKFKKPLALAVFSAMSRNWTLKTT